LLACGKIPDAAERVRCYDAQVAAMNPPATATPAPAPPAGSLPPAVATAAVTPETPASAPVAAAAKQEKSAEGRFGVEDLPRAKRKAEARQDVLLSSITALRAFGQNRYVISLANGQVWRQAGSEEAFLFFRIGDEVRIERGAMGSYHLSTAASGLKNWVQVIRVQ
jgi:hypothetical protein